MRMDKYNKKTGVKPKTREICYAAHMDRCIYQYYSAILNENYNKYLIEQNIESVPVAYRTNLKRAIFILRMKHFNLFEKIRIVLF